MNRLVVLDSGVAAKWYLPRTHEPLAEEAVSLLRQNAANELDFLVPDFFFVELANIFWKAARLKRWSDHSARQALRAAESYSLPSVPAKDLLDDALQIALATERTVYDSVYVALAIRAGGEFVTADERLANAIGSAFPVKWLGLC